MELSDVTKVLGGEKVLRRKVRSPMDLIELSSKGITKAALVHLVKYLSLTALGA